MEFKLLKNTFGLYNAYDIEKYINCNKKKDCLYQLLNITKGLTNNFNKEKKDYNLPFINSEEDAIMEYKYKAKYTYENENNSWNIKVVNIEFISNDL